jgi:hypothetical protein
MDEFNMSPKVTHDRSTPINGQPKGPVISLAEHCMSNTVVFKGIIRASLSRKKTFKSHVSVPGWPPKNSSS